MKVALFKVDENLCAECSLAIRRFISGIDGVESIDVYQGNISVKFNETAVDKDRVTKITRDSIERLGYRIDE